MARFRQGDKKGRPVSPQFLNDLEQGRRDVPDDMTEPLARALGIDANVLRAAAGRAPKEAAQYAAYLAGLGAAGVASGGVAAAGALIPGIGAGAVGLAALAKVFRRAKETGFNDWVRVLRVIEEEEKKKSG
jgi:hypothetical protein